MNTRALLDGLKAGPAVLADFVSSIPQDRLKYRRGSAWTILEHVEHLAQTQEMLFGRLERFISEDRPVFVPFFPEDEPDGQEAGEPDGLRIDASAAPAATAAVERFRTWRGRQVALLENASDDVWRREAEHPEYERYGFSILVRHILLHDSFHMYRMEELWLTKDEYLTEL